MIKYTVRILKLRSKNHKAYKVHTSRIFSSSLECDEYSKPKGLKRFVNQDCQRNARVIDSASLVVQNSCNDHNVFERELFFSDSGNGRVFSLI
jgi:hypothetical protein